MTSICCRDDNNFILFVKAISTLCFFTAGPPRKVKPGAHDICHSMTPNIKSKSRSSQSLPQTVPNNNRNPRLNCSSPLERFITKLQDHNASTMSQSSHAGWRTSSRRLNPWRNRSVPLSMHDDQLSCVDDRLSSCSFEYSQYGNRILGEITNKPPPLSQSALNCKQPRVAFDNLSFINMVASTPSHKESVLYPNVHRDENRQESGKDMVDDASFINIVTSTPRSTPLPGHKEFDQNQPTFHVPIKMPALESVSTVNRDCLSKKRLFDTEDDDVQLSVDENDLEDKFYDSSSDPDWNSDDASETTDETDYDLNDLSIFEYFQKYHTLDELGLDDDLEIQETPPPDQSFDKGETSALQEHVNKATMINLSIEAMEVMARECLEPKVSKAKERANNKRRKEKGLQYTRSDGIVIPARKIRPACSCRRRCFNKYPDHVRSKLLRNFLNLKLSGQNQFLANHMEVSKTARRKVINSRRLYSRSYKLPGVKGPVVVCKVMFMATFDVGDRKLRNLAAKRVIGDGVASDDQRSENRSARTISAEHQQYIKDHILSFPAYSSHYGREKSERLYLSGDLNLTSLYKLYQAKCGTDNLVAVCYDSYRIIFKTFNLHFRKPKIDTCDECDRLNVEIKIATEEKEIIRLKQVRDDHQKAAQRVYDQKNADVERSKIDYTVRTVSFDLQKQLPTPFLKCGVAFYKRQLYTLNLSFLESYLGQNKAYCYMWDETRARRGSKEVGSCVMQDLQRMPTTVEEVIYYSDRCAGQNHNKNVVFMFTHVLKNLKKEGRALRIIHRFMKTGHSHMEVDTIHATIERAKKRTEVSIEIPSDWEIFIAAIQRTVPIEVVSMQQKDFLDITALEEIYTIPKTTTSGETFSFKKVMEFAFTTDNIGTVRFKYDLAEEDYKEICLMSGKKIDREIELKRIESQLIELPTAKLKDLRSLLPYVVKKDYYEAFLKGLVEPKRGRRPNSNDAPDHFEGDIYDTEDEE
ncbi:uncharacterized protein LOC115263741 isoform X2 [Aedes albopictus]|uniref:Uncharacterized protein n=1 Tax=Aedes albopictus TaxID=7160 RepID=A0ABM1XR73_AEDAL